MGALWHSIGTFLHDRLAPAGRVLPVPVTNSSSPLATSTITSSSSIPEAVVPVSSTESTISPSVNVANTLSTPPRLTRFPKLILTPLEKEQFLEKNQIKVGEGDCPVKTVLPSPPPLTVIMPISTRKEKRSIVRAKESQTSVVKSSSSNSSNETVRNRLRPGSQRISESTSNNGAAPSTAIAPTTPRKIIEEIFGPGKSKKYKGPGRKKKRSGVTSPKKVKGRVDTDSILNQPIHEARNETEDNSGNIEEITNFKQEDYLTDIKIDLENEVETKAGSHDDDGCLEDDIEVKTEEDDEGDERIKEYEQTADDDEDDFDTVSVASSTRRTSKRKASHVANEKLKQMGSQGDVDCNKSESSSLFTMSKEEQPGKIRSRRSTTDGSSKSSNSATNVEDSESSYGRSFENKHLTNVERQGINSTPLSLISEDGDRDDDVTKLVDIDGVSIGDLQEHRDSDVDSTYSWKPVRAAAVIAMEQVTKKHESVAGSTGLPGDAETKAAAVADRRARKIMRYKGRNRRTLLFKSSSSKKAIAARNSRNSAQPTILPKVFHHGSYFQAGDVVFIEMENESVNYGQIKGLLMDPFGETSASIRWLVAKSILYESLEFSPFHYEIRYDVPERLIKIGYVNFVMHLNLDYFEGHPSFGKIEKFSIYSRLGKSIHPLVKETDKGSTILADQSSSTSQSDNEKKNVKKKNVDDEEDNGNSSDDTIQGDISDSEESIAKFEDDIAIAKDVIKMENDEKAAAIAADNIIQEDGKDDSNRIKVDVLGNENSKKETIEEDIESQIMELNDNARIEIDEGILKETATVEEAKCDETAMIEQIFEKENKETECVVVVEENVVETIERDGDEC